MIPIFIITLCYNHFSNLYHRLIHSERGTNDNSVFQYSILIKGPWATSLTWTKVPCNILFRSICSLNLRFRWAKTQFLIQIKKKTQKLCFLIFLLHFFHVCTLRRRLKLEIVKSCQKQCKVSTRINGDKDWEKIWVSWWWSQDEAGNCQQNCSDHWQF